MAYTVLTFVSHHLLRPEPSVAALAEGDAALNGLGLACLPDHALRPSLQKDGFSRCWCPPFPGYQLYYPSCRQNSPAFALLIEALRWRG
ncbi:MULTISPECIES: hypothetical protein [unclassified Mesorhizobium]|uniref:hypothetical protein n=1 Tax=unclassified Mesorhizobium TaxID=325217 RepID=UPI0019D0E74E